MYLGIDLGTSGVKVLLMAPDQTVVASATSPLDVQRRQTGWSEQNPTDWISATEQAIEQLKADHAKAYGMHGEQFIEGKRCHLLHGRAMAPFAVTVKAGCLRHCESLRLPVFREEE